MMIASRLVLQWTLPFRTKESFINRLPPFPQAVPSRRKNKFHCDSNHFPLEPNWASCSPLKNLAKKMGENERWFSRARFGRVFSAASSVRNKWERLNLINFMISHKINYVWKGGERVRLCSFPPLADAFSLRKKLQGIESDVEHDRYFFQGDQREMYIWVK